MWGGCSKVGGQYRLDLCDEVGICLSNTFVSFHIYLKLRFLHHQHSFFFLDKVHEIFVL